MVDRPRVEGAARSPASITTESASSPTLAADAVPGAFCRAGRREPCAVVTTLYPGP